jgi:Ca2+-binding RTX toxin-like protein
MPDDDMMPVDHPGPMFVVIDGRLNIEGTSGADTLVGDDNGDVIHGQNGDDSIVGGAQHNALNGMMGDDTVVGGDGGDWVLGGKGDDSLVGGAGADLVNGNIGNDTENGGAGDDTVRGGQGDDSLSGGPGNDFISGDKGDDTLAGGPGADTFNFFAGGGHDVVVDFNAGEGDKVHIEGNTPYTVAEIGGDVVITLAGHETMVLKHVDLSSLGDGWITSG